VLVVISYRLRTPPLPLLGSVKRGMVHPQPDGQAYIPHPFRNSEAILPASLQEEETELAVDAFIAYNPLFL
jgi:hypothetical protein